MAKKSNRSLLENLWQTFYHQFDHDKLRGCDITTLQDAFAAGISSTLKALDIGDDGSIDIPKTLALLEDLDKYWLKRIQQQGN